MPQLIFLVLIGALAYYGYRSFTREAKRVTARAERKRREAASGSEGTLVKNPETGEYYLEKD